MIKKMLNVCLLLVFSSSLMLCGCHSGDNYIKKDEFTSDGKLKLEYFATQLDALQSPTDDTKKILEYVEDRFDVKFTFTTGTSTTWQAQLNKLIGAGDVPDLFFHDAKDPSYSQWLEEEILFNYSSKMDEYPNIKKQFEIYEDTLLKNYLGGEWYSMPLILDSETEASVISQHGMFYRRDWYERLVETGYQPTSGRALVDPEDENFDYLNFYDLLEGFTYGDLGDLAANFHSGYGSSKDGGLYWWYPILSMFGVEYDGWRLDGDKYVQECISNEMKEAVLFMADMFDNGLLPQNFNSSMTKSNMISSFGNGEIGVISTETSYSNCSNIMTLLQKYIPEGGTISDVVCPMPVVSGKNGEKQIKGIYNFYGYTAINNDITDNKKNKILEIIDWMLSAEGMTMLNYGIEGEHYEIENGEVHSLLGTDRTGNAYYFHSADIAPGIYSLKSIVSWSSAFFDSLKYYTESQRFLNEWKQSGHLVLNQFEYMRVSPSLTIVAASLNDTITTAFKSIVAENKGNREQIWSSFVNEVNNSKYDAYRDAVNEYAKIWIRES